jgi:hypothetical protein
MGERATLFQSPWAKRVGKWLNRSVLGLFFVTLIVFQAPWKLTLIWAYPTIRSFITFPKNVQKWETRFFIGCIVGLLIWMLIPSNPDGYRPFQFTEELAAIEKQRAITPEQDAYPVYDKLFHASDPNDRSVPDWVETEIETFMNRPWIAADNPRLSEWLDRRQRILAALKPVLQYDYCRFPLEPQFLLSDWATEQTKMLKSWARMLVLTANRFAGQKDIPKAIEICKLLSGLSKHQFQQLDQIPNLIGLAFLTMTCSETVLLAVQPETSEADLDEMDRLLSSTVLPQQDHWYPIMEWEKLCIKNDLCKKVYEVNEKGQVRFSRASCQKMAAGNCREFLRPFGTNFIVAHAWLILPGDPYELVKCIDDYYSKLIQVKSVDDDFDRIRDQLTPSFRLNHTYLVGFCTSILASSYEKYPDISLRCQARWQASKIVIGLRRYKDETGHWPDSLSELHGKISPDLMIDPSNGGEFVYRREGDSFRFYSKGKKGIDDGGLRDKKTKTDDYLYWPIEPSPDSGHKTEKPLHPDANPS